MKNDHALRRWLLATTFSVVASVTASAQQRQPSFIIGPGAQTCAHVGQGVANYGMKAFDAYYSWMQGYLSGINTTIPKHERIDLFPPGYGFEAQEEFLRAYCAANPLRRIDEVSAELFNRLRVRNGKKPYLQITVPQ